MSKLVQCTLWVTRLYAWVNWSEMCSFLRHIIGNMSEFNGDMSILFLDLVF